MKKKKLNNGGFVLVETLIVSVFVMSIFSILYNNFFPLIGEYEKREVYDDVDAKYATYWIKRMIQDPTVKFTTQDLADIDSSNLSSPGYFEWNCDYLGGDVSKKKACERILKATQVRETTRIVNIGGVDTDVKVPHIYVTTYNLEVFKGKIEQSNDFSGGMHKYLAHLPVYRVDSLNDAKYRVIVEFHRTRDDNDYLAYATFEVKK